MQDALRQIRDTLGDDAIIVSSKEEASGWVRITAAVEQNAAPAPADRKPVLEKEKPASKPAAPADDTPAPYDSEEIIEMITDTLLRHRVPAAVSEKILAAASLDSSGNPQTALAKGLAKAVTFAPAPAPKDPLILVGPPGAGKTLMTAKLAAQGVLAGRKPVVITTDIARAGGVEQLSAFLDILELPLHQAEDEKSLQKILARENSSDIIIDTGGLNPFDPQEMKYLARLMATSDMDAALVLPAGGDAEESAEMAMTFGVLGVKRLIPTRLDFARRFGGILNAASKAGLAVGLASHTPQVAHGIIEMTPQKMAELLMPAPSKSGAAKER